MINLGHVVLIFNACDETSVPAFHRKKIRSTHQGIKQNIAFFGNLIYNIILRVKAPFMATVGLALWNNVIPREYKYHISNKTNPAKVNLRWKKKNCHTCRYWEKSHCSVRCFIDIFIHLTLHLILADCSKSQTANQIGKNMLSKDSRQNWCRCAVIPSAHSNSYSNDWRWTVSSQLHCSFCLTSYVLLKVIY